MPRLLLVDSDVLHLESWRTHLHRNDLEIDTARGGLSALSLCQHCTPAAALISLDLPDISGLSVLETLSQDGVACALLAHVGTCRLAVDAMRRGALDVLEKPLTGGDLESVVDVLLNSRPAPSPISELQPHAVQRWADLVLRAVPLKEDPRTLREWGHAIGVSEGALRNWCRTARISARRSLTFARMLRAVVQHNQHARIAPEDLLNVVDRRTIAKLLAQSSDSRTALPATPREFLEQQRIVDNEFAVKEVAKALRYR